MNKAEQIQQDLVTAQKNKDTVKVNTLRLLISEIKNFAINSKISLQDLSNDQVEAVLDKQAKQRKDSIEAFEKANRDDLVKIEQSELDIIMQYLPQKITGGQLEEAVKVAIESSGAISKAQMGLVMKNLKDEYGSSIDMKEASNLVNSMLN